MTGPPWEPDIPLPPGRPPLPTQPSTVPPVPVVDLGYGPAQELLTDQRRILVSGRLDGPAVTTLCAQLMALDGQSSRPVEVVVNSSGGPLADIFPALDVLELMRAKVNVSCIGSVSGTAVALVVSGSGTRRAGPHVRFSLRCDERQLVEGTASEIARQADEMAALRARYLDALEAATGQARAWLDRQLDGGPSYSADRARELGIVDTVDHRDRS